MSCSETTRELTLATTAGVPDIRLWLAPRDTVRPADWLAHLTGLSADTLPLHRDAHGKPWLDLPHSPLRFNWSHSRHWLLLAWSTAIEAIGVDIEDAGRTQRFDDLARRYFHANELARWQVQPDAACWLRLWTRKEAVLKAHGLGLRVDLRDLDASTNRVRHPALGDWSVASLDGPDWIASVSWR